jgi:hypothetical protein
MAAFLIEARGERPLYLSKPASIFDFDAPTNTIEILTDLFGGSSNGGN